MKGKNVKNKEKSRWSSRSIRIIIISACRIIVTRERQKPPRVRSVATILMFFFFTGTHFCFDFCFLCTYMYKRYHNNTKT